MQKIYQINLRNLLKELEIYGINQIPNGFWLDLKSKGFELIWMLGAWKICDYSQAFSVQNSDAFNSQFDSDLVLVDKEFVGSCFAIEDYIFDLKLGTPEDFLSLKERLNSLGLKLILDFIPNHFGRSSDLVKSNPNLFLEAKGVEAGKSFGVDFVIDTTSTYLENNSQIQNSLNTETKTETKYFYHAKDPHFEPWQDTVQINYSKPETHQFMRQKLQFISQFCDGVRCDMAMLVLPEVFSSTWEGALDSFANRNDDRDFWQESIGFIKSRSPNFLFLAEAYWDLETQIFELGFDYVYNKDFLDSVKTANLNWLGESLRIPNSIFFLENHDETRSTSAFVAQDLKLAIALLAFCPGLQFYQHGQLQGNSTRLPIQVSGKQVFAFNPEIQALYQGFFDLISGELFGSDSNFSFVRISEFVVGLIWKNTDSVLTLMTNFGLQKYEFNLAQVLGRDISKSPIIDPKSPRKISFDSSQKAFVVRTLEVLNLDLQSTNYSIESKDFAIFSASSLNS